MSEKRQNHEETYPTVYPTGPGSNPSSFPGFNVPVDPSSGLPGDVPDDGAEGEYITLTDGRRITPDGEPIADPPSPVREVRPDYAYTPDEEDLDLIIT
jgi:hypothetical protein